LNLGAFASEQGCQILLGTTYQNPDKYTKYVYIKRPYTIPTSSNVSPSKIYPNRDFWFENMPSGNPASEWEKAFLVATPENWFPRKCTFQDTTARSVIRLGHLSPFWKFFYIYKSRPKCWAIFYRKFLQNTCWATLWTKTCGLFRRQPRRFKRGCFQSMEVKIQFCRLSYVEWMLLLTRLN
jgi:hypothetical protein